MKAKRTRRLLNEIDWLTVNGPSQLKNRDNALGHIFATEIELVKLENLSDIGQAYQWAYENGIVTIDPESLVNKFMEVER